MLTEAGNEIGLRVVSLYFLVVKFRVFVVGGATVDVLPLGCSTAALLYGLGVK